jgi:hypothetical protein
MFLPKTSDSGRKLSSIAEFGAIIDQRLEKIEAHIAEIEGRITNRPSNIPDSGMFVSEPEPEYGEISENITYV